MRSPGGDASPTPEDGTRRPRLAKRRCLPRWTHPSRAECGLLVMNEWATASKHVVQVSTKQKWHEDPRWRDVDLVGTSRCSNTCRVWSGRCIRPCPQTEGPRVCSLHPLAQQKSKASTSNSQRTTLWQRCQHPICLSKKGELAGWIGAAFASRCSPFPAVCPIPRDCSRWQACCANLVLPE